MTLTEPTDQTSNATSSTHQGHSIIKIDKAFHEKVMEITDRLKNQDNLHLPLDRVLNILDELTQFDLGRFLLINRSMNGYWTSYIFNNIGQSKDNELETWILNRSLLTQAAERQQRFKALIQAAVKPGCQFASIPCGLMDDLLHVDYRSVEAFSLTGIDFDKDAIIGASEQAKQKNVSEHCQFECNDAWALTINNQFDLISSNGLNMYESDEQRLIDLYRVFANALKPSGQLLISFLPPPPDGTDPNYTWANYNISHEDLLVERAIFGDILEAKFLNFTTPEKLATQMSQAGLKLIDINTNANGVLPIAIAEKI